MQVVIPVSQCKVTHNFDKTNNFSKNFWCALVFSRDFWRPKTAKFKIYLIFEDCRGFRCGSHFVAVVVPTGCRWCRVQDLQDLPSVGFGPLVVRSLLLSALSLCAWCVACKYALISRSKGVFRAVWGVCVGLCYLRALRGLCGFCARVELGG